MEWTRTKKNTFEHEDQIHAIERRVSTLRTFPYFIVYSGVLPIEDGFGRLMTFNSLDEAKQFIAEHIALKEAAWS
jgi:hypothetical protein